MTKNGDLVTDPEELRHVFQLYHAAYMLYTPPIMELSAEIEQLDSFLVNAPLALMEPQQFLKPRQQQIQATLRALLTDQRLEEPLQPLFDQTFAETPETIEDALSAFAEVVHEQEYVNADLLAVSDDLNIAFDQLKTTVGISEASLQAVRFLAQILFLSHLREDRSEWLNLYVQNFPSGDAAFDREQLRATAGVLDEVKNDVTQRVDRAVEVGTELLVEEISEYGQDQLLQLAINIASQLAAKSGEQLTSQAAASYLATLSIGITVNSILYNTDDAAVSLKLAQNSQDLNAVFMAGRKQTQEEATATNEPIEVYDGDLVEEFRVAYLLEGLSALQAQRSFADLASALVERPNLLSGITTLLGEDWQAIAEQLHEHADEMEKTWLDTMATPAFIELAVALALTSVSEIAPSGNTLTGNPLEIEGELALVHEGNLYLYNIATGESSQLTDAGTDARPAWSSDGRYLVFERWSAEKPDLYLIDMEIGEERIFSQNACCAGWSPTVPTIAYISYDDGGLLKTESLDGTIQETVDSGMLVRGIESAPTGSISWGPNSILYVPMFESMRGMAEVNNGESIEIEIIYTYDLNQQYENGGGYISGDLDMPWIPDIPTCFYEPTTSRNEAQVVITRRQNCGEENAYDEIVYREANSEWQILNIGAHPSLSADGLHLAFVDLVRCDETNYQIRGFCSAGIHVVDMATRESWLATSLGTSPAWRPKPTSTASPNDVTGSTIGFEEIPLVALIQAQGELVATGRSHSAWSGSSGSPLALWSDPTWVYIPALQSFSNLTDLVLSPDKSLIAFVEDDVNSQIIGVMDIFGGSRRILVETDRNLTSLVVNWSPDSRKLVVADSLHEYVDLIDVGSGSIQTMWKGDVWDVIFTQDGNDLLISYAEDEQGVLIRYDPQSGEELRLATLPLPVEGMTWSPDGTQMAFTYNWIYRRDRPETKGLWLMNGDGTGIQQLTADADVTAVCVK